MAKQLKRPMTHSSPSVFEVPRSPPSRCYVRFMKQNYPLFTVSNLKFGQKKNANRELSPQLACFANVILSIDYIISEPGTMVYSFCRFL
jgi:hypothetical protein